MPHIAPVTEPVADDKAAETLGRLRELFGEEPLPAPFLVYARVPAFLQDFYMNFKKFVWTAGRLEVPVKHTIALAVAYHCDSPAWIDFFAPRVSEDGKAPDRPAEVAAIVATNAMYNAFFKFRAIAGSDVFSGMGVGLRAHTFAGTSLDERTIELIDVAISDLNGCQPCTAGHVEKARNLGWADEAILEAVQCAATMAAGAKFLAAAQ
jgi:alkyl hydroperoxide reductase subunit D